MKIVRVCPFVILLVQGAYAARETLKLTPHETTVAPCSAIRFVIQPPAAGAPVKWELDPQEGTGGITPQGVYFAPENFDAPLFNVIASVNGQQLKAILHPKKQ